jgi:cob(I)alamin adenosyltransferase
VPQAVSDVLGRLQHEMFVLGAELASPSGNVPGILLLADANIREMESDIDRFEADLHPLRNFILPGGVPAAAALHAARCVCRRAESEIVALSRLAPVRAILLEYANRVSDLLFVLARWCNNRAGVADVPWEKS